MRCPRREKVFGPGRAVPLDRNAKARIAAYARAWSARNRQPRQHRGRSPAPSWTCWRRCCGASTTAASGCCFPSYEAIAAKAECARTTVAEAIKALEWAGVLTWQHRITRIRERVQRPVRAMRLALAGDPHQQRLRVQRPETAACRRSCF